MDGFSQMLRPDILRSCQSAIVLEIFSILSKALALKRKLSMVARSKSFSSFPNAQCLRICLWDICALNEILPCFAAGPSERNRAS
jgi:hypothetical protein